MGNCLHCKKEFSLKSKFHPHQKFCSDKCRKNYNSIKLYWKNPKKYKSIFKKLYWKNPEKYRAKARKHPKPKKRKEKICVYCGKSFYPKSLFHPHQKYCSYKCHDAIKIKKWRKNNKENWLHSARRSKIKRKNLLYGNPPYTKPKLTYKEKEELKERDNNKCVYCGSTEKLGEDHIIAVKNGGLDIKENVVIACKKCNNSKSYKDVFEWCKSKNKIVPIVILQLLNKQSSLL